MARRSTPQPPDDRSLTPAQMRSGIARLRSRIDELKALDASTIRDYRSPQIVKLETDIESTLAAIFGERTSKFNRFQGSTNLEPAPNLSITPDWVGVRGGYHDHGPDARELQQGIDERRNRAVAILEGAISALEEELQFHPDESPPSKEPTRRATHSTQEIFIVHGRDDGPREAVARFLERLDLKPIILHEQANQGRTVIEKVEAHSNVGFAVILLTPDDEGALKGEPLQPRARQNVLLELGYFIGKLSRARVCTLVVGKPEIPSDWRGVIDEPFDAGGAWKQTLARELDAAGYDIDWNKVMR